MRLDPDFTSAPPPSGHGPAPEMFTRLAESDHRIANNLAAIAAIVRLEANNTERQTYTASEVKRLLNEVAGRIDVTARLHRAMLNITEDDQLDYASYLADICTNALAALGQNHGMSLYLDLAPHALMPASRLLSIGMIVNEAVTNAVKYAHPSGVAGRIDVSTRREGANGLFVVIEDDGVGLPPHFDTRDHSGTGFRLMHALAAQNNFQLSQRSSPFGLRFQIVAPPT